VLDGQQRLTTFFLVLRGNYVIRNTPYDLYFNLLSGEVEDDDGNLFEFQFFNEKKGSHFAEDPKKGAPQKLWFRVKTIFDIKDLEDIGDQLKEIAQSKYALVLTSPQKKAAAKLLRLLRYEKLVYYYPEVENNYDKVLDIFVRTNRGGTVLTYSDLLFSTVKMLWPEARTLFEGILDKLDGDDRYKFTADFILKAVLVCYAKDRDGIRYLTKNFSRGLIDTLKDGEAKQGEWMTRIQPSILLVGDLVRDHFWLTSNKLLSSYNALIPLIYWSFKRGRKSVGEEKGCITSAELADMRLWLMKALLQGTFGGQADNMLHVCKTAIDASTSDCFPAAEIASKLGADTTRSMEVNVEAVLDKTRYRQPGSYLILSTAYGNAVNFVPQMDGNVPEQDHIFSHAELTAAKVPEEQINSISNIRLVERSPNRIKSDTPFGKWIVGRTAEEREKHSIPDGNWGVATFPEFLVARKKLLMNKFHHLTGG
jgi:hypothetical protein